MKNSINLSVPDFMPLALSIYVDAKEIPQGVLVLLCDWPRLRSAIDPKSPFYKLMANLTFVPFHERSLKEKSELLEGKIREAEKANLENGSFVTYKNSLCTTPDLFINEYSDRKELVSVDAGTGSIQVVRKLN
ncbi:hypothetical protein [Pedobacter sp. V48]|uniref:hypothetical protein n=1 Tax=Pedobacter sp. V48 TaxID=509635 RepID=UPI0003E581E6|nr:hypothetical protein [Pedobacter sp. V48]ETZ19547.1 hypothetical protein N824_12460 [Pedobacter sp. V48]